MKACYYNTPLNEDRRRKEKMNYIYTLYKIDKIRNDIKYLFDFENMEQVANFINRSYSRIKHLKIIYNTIDNLDFQELENDYIIIKELDKEYTN